jgi:Protein of unknown function (DUF1186)
MSSFAYNKPVAQLLTLGECDPQEPAFWIDYGSLGITAEHCPELIQVATDLELFALEEEAVEGWAVVHAWRALGQLQCIAAVEPLLGLCDREEETDPWREWITEEVPLVCATLGEAAIPALAKCLTDQSRNLWARCTAMDSLEQIAGVANAAIEQQCVAIFTESLTHFAEQDSEFNGLLVGALVELGAVESAPIIEQAFAANQVDDAIAGDWEDVQGALGLGDQPVRSNRGDAVVQEVEELLRLPMPDLENEDEDLEEEEDWDEEDLDEEEFHKPSDSPR